MTTYVLRTYIYVDGFNLFYGAVKDTPHKWLDLKALFKGILKPYNQIQAIKYYTAMVSARPGDLNAPTHQTAYLRALKAHIPELSVTMGVFLQNTVTMCLAKPPLIGSKFAQVLKTEEKGSDVNLALHMLNDAWNDLYDCAVVCSNDSDLSEALRIVKTERKKKIILAVPGDPKDRPPSNQLRRYANYVLSIPVAALAASQLPNPIPGTRLHKPPGW